MRRARPVLQIALATLACLAAVTAAAMVGTGLDRQRTAFITASAQGDRPVAGWSRPCWKPGRKGGAGYTLACASVRGRVLHVEREDPDGDHDAHLVLLAGPRLVVVKIPAGAGIRRLPGVGTRVRAVGFAERGGIVTTVRLPVATR
jgi:hypothetical protein